MTKDQKMLAAAVIQLKKKDETIKELEGLVCGLQEKVDELREQIKTLCKERQIY